VKKLFAVVAFVCATSSANAQSFRYDFTALSSLPIGPSTEMITGSFSYISANPITTKTSVTVPQVTNCSAVSSLGNAICLGGIFTPGSNDLVQFDVQTAANGPTSVYYYFASNSFDTPGSYKTVTFGAEQAGTLTVTRLGSSTVPEPQTWALTIAGLGAIVVMQRKRRAV
jgi:hypothetical protein